MYKQIAFGVLLTLIGCAVLVDSTVAYAQIEGALQYPPPSVGEDAQPPPPARMVPQTVSPRRIELGVSGSSQLPTNYPYRVRPRTDDIDRLPVRPAPLLRASPIPPPSAGGN